MTIKTITKSLALAAACTSLSAFAGTPAPAPAAGPAPAPVDLWTGSVTLGWDTDYIFRGLHVTDDLVTAALDLNFTLSDNATLNLNAWYANGSGTADNYDELNLYAKVLFKINDSFSIGPSFRWYTYPDFGGGDQYEPGLELAWIPCANTTVNFGVFYETETDALYAELGAAYTHKVNDTFSFVFGGLISYLDRDDFSPGDPVVIPPIPASGFDTSGFNHAALYIKAPITLKSNLTLTPYIAWNIPMDTIEDLDGLNPGQDDDFYGGIALTAGF
jgi:hypothetical protein